ncbi:MAG TPA: alpha/beta hydrolase-fold protein [Verrucomicrobiae bacterium]|jgi:enterochelin esterase-like enzyme|nr:alpha/beta hydrolase-fold protein [Verrucomicrobiae bacterium]
MNTSDFRTVEVSDPRFESENLRCVTVKSRALGHRADLTVFVPKQCHGLKEAPLVILLHGVYGSHWAWALKGGAHRTAARLIEQKEIPPMLLAMPSDGLWGDGSGYLPHGEADFERWIVEEVPVAARAASPALGGNSPLFISGLSMGGFGALRLAGKHPEKFAGAGGHSSMTHFDQFPMFVEEPLEHYACKPEDRSVLEVLLRNRLRLPPLRFDCGSEDQLIQYNRELSRELTKAGVRHIYEEFPGAHSWPYWELHLSDMLRFFGGCLKQ